MIWADYNNRAALMTGLADQMAGELRAAIAKDGRASLSVPGGTTPGPVFDLLAQTDLDWSKVAIFLNDERWVSQDNPRSNTALIRARLVTGRAAAAQVIPLYRNTALPEQALADLSDGIAPHLPITVLLLGMGADMHTASLFPDADLLAEALAPEAPILMALRAKNAGEPRITLTAPVLAAASHIHILITGAEKRAAILRAEGLDPMLAPVGVVLARATIHWAE
jgi:6-phosphogluconolactonase